MPRQEILGKWNRLTTYLERHNLDGVLLKRRAHFAWLTGGRDNRSADATAGGAAAVLVTPDQLVCLTDSSEASRVRQEVLADTGIDVIDYPWHDPSAEAVAVATVVAGRKVATDVDPQRFGLQPLPADFAELRWSLTEAEVDRYRDGAARAAAAVEEACRSIEYDDAEWEVAGLLAYYLRRAGCTAIATLVAADDRVAAYRNPAPTDKRIEHYVALSVCAEFGGLTSCLTRLVSFRPMTELEGRQQNLADIEAALYLSTRPGRTVGGVFDVLEQAYADAGFPGEWQSRPQGGATGYLRREVVARPDSDIKVRDNQAFAWSPSVPGTRGEDTILCTDDGYEVLTAASDDWPTMKGRFGGREVRRPDVLVR